MYFNDDQLWSDVQEEIERQIEELDWQSIVLEQVEAEAKEQVTLNYEEHHNEVVGLNSKMDEQAREIDALHVKIEATKNQLYAFMNRKPWWKIW